MLNYSIHTYQLFVKLSYNEYYDLLNKLNTLNASIEKQNTRDTIDFGEYPIVRKSYFYRKLKMPGISEIELFRIVVLSPEHEHDVSVLQAGAYIRINPYNAVHALHNSTHDIVDAYDIETAAQLVSDKLLTLLGDEIHSRLKLCRCDFCVNLPFDSADTASLYIKLLQKCIPKPSLKEPTCIDPVSHHAVPKYPDSLLLECGSYSFEVYSKQAQMKNKNIGNSDFATGLVRLELRAEKAKLDTLYKKYGGSPKNYIAFLKNAPTACSLEIIKLLAPMVGTGDFVSYHKVKKQISKKIKNEFTQSEMKKCVKIILKHKRCHTLLKDNNLTYADWKRFLVKFDKINCSPITIPSREGIDYLPGILSLDEYFA